MKKVFAINEILFSLVWEGPWGNGFSGEMPPGRGTNWGYIPRREAPGNSPGYAFGGIWPGSYPFLKKI